MFFNVTDEHGQGRHGGQFKYSLPRGKRPGAWTEPATGPMVCKEGYHLTVRPERWWTFDQPNRIFVAEGRGAMAIEKGDEAAFEAVRLLQEITPKWELLPLYPVVGALLMSEFRRANGPDMQWPAWADLGGADLAGADLGGADLGGADLAGADLGGADLGGADLGGADLAGADLGGAYLSGANLRGAYLSGAYLTGADLGGRSLTREEWNKELEIDPTTGLVGRTTRLPW